jgi:hypothetical protein
MLCYCNETDPPVDMLSFFLVSTLSVTDTFELCSRLQHANIYLEK